MKLWQSANGASLEYVAAKRGWPVITYGPVTVAIANGTIYYEGSDLTLVNAAVRLLED